MIDEDNCEHNNCSFIIPKYSTSIELISYDRDDVEEEIEVEVKCNDCGERVNAVYTWDRTMSK